MKEENVKVLNDSFPTVYPKNTWIECGDGWLELLIDIGTFISSRSRDCKAVQVKEKFGVLRFYVEFSYNEIGVCSTSEEAVNQIYNYITEKENTSENICEDCGANLNDNNRQPQEKLGYWIRNICQNCAASQKKNWQK